MTALPLPLLRTLCPITHASIIAKTPRIASPHRATSRPRMPMVMNRTLAITRAYTRAIFDLHFRDKPQPLMTAPSASYPEITFIG